VTEVALRVPEHAAEDDEAGPRGVPRHAGALPLRDRRCNGGGGHRRETLVAEPAAQVHEVGAVRGLRVGAQPSDPRVEPCVGGLAEREAGVGGGADVLGALALRDRELAARRGDPTVYDLPAQASGGVTPPDLEAPVGPSVDPAFDADTAGWLPGHG